MKLFDRNNAKKAFPMTAFIAIAVFVGLLYAMALFGFMLPYAQYNNTVEYAMMLCIFACAFFVMYMVSMLFPGYSRAVSRAWERKLRPKVYSILYFAIIAIIAALLVHRRIYAELSDYAVSAGENTIHAWPVGLTVFLFVLAGGTALWFAYSGKDVPRSLAACCYLALICVSFVIAFAPNVFQNDIHHTTAYIESILNVYHMTPYTKATTGVYGHYGLFFAPFLWLLPESVWSGSILLALVGVFAGVLCIYVIHNVTDKNWMRILGTVSCFQYTATRIGTYWQVQPHRVVFPLLMIAYVLQMTRKDCWKKRHIVAGYVICSCAMLWNFESGLFSAIAFTAALVVHDWQRFEWYSWKMVKRYCCYAAGVAVSLVAAIAVMNMYNFLCGYNSIEIESFFFPINKDSYMVGTITWNMTAGNKAWVYVLILFGGLLVSALYDTKLFHRSMDEVDYDRLQSAPVTACVAAAGLLNFTYYANRAAYLNLDIVLQAACMAMCLLWRRHRFAYDGRDEKDMTIARLWSSVVGTLPVLVLAVLTLQTVAFLPKTIRIKANQNHYDVASFENASEELAGNIPDNTFAFGSSISLLYHHLGWDTIGHYRDMSDITVGGGNYEDEIVRDALEQDAFVVLLSVREDAENQKTPEKRILDKILKEDGSYALSYETRVCGYPIQYYTRNPAPDSETEPGKGNES